MILREIGHLVITFYIHLFDGYKEKQHRGMEEGEGQVVQFQGCVHHWTHRLVSVCLHVNVKL